MKIEAFPLYQERAWLRKRKKSSEENQLYKGKDEYVSVSFYGKGKGNERSLGKEEKLNKERGGEMALSAATGLLGTHHDFISISLST